MTTTAQSDLGSLIAKEGGRAARTRSRRSLSASPRSRRAWFTAIGAATAWCLWTAGVGRRQVTNRGGIELFGDFFAAALHPRVDRSFVIETLRNSAITVSYAAVATVLSVIIGLAGAFALSEVVWKRSFAVNARRHLSLMSCVRWPVRVLSAIPRGIHEAVWGLLFINILGRDPLAAVLAIAIPYGAVTAKVYAEIIDESARAPFALLRSSGASRSHAMLYAILPTVSRDLVSYGFYRLECSLRSAVILGMIGAGGLGFQLAVSFQGSAYSEIWTSVYALVILGTAAEWWAAGLRRRQTTTRSRSSVIAATVIFLASWWYLDISVSTLWAPRARKLARQLWGDLFPPRLPRGGLGELVDAARESLQMSFLAIVIATVLAIPIAFLGARTRRSWIRRPAVRLFAMLLRSIPPTVWALLVLFVVLPGILPGAIALGIYTAGVLGRLYGDALENASLGPRDLLLASGAQPRSAALYATLPEVAPTWTAFSLYRWEVAARESVVVGIVGAGGLGRLISAQTNAFAFATLTSTLIMIIVLTLFVDTISSATRRSLR